MVREVFIKLKMDKKNLGTADWNPFSDFINEGDQVLIKPNFVKHYHHLGRKGVLSQITHAAVLRPIIDYIFLALNDTGRIIIADTPLEKADFQKILKITKTSDLRKFYKEKLKKNIELFDLRSYKRKISKRGNFLLKKVRLPGPPHGFFKIDLKNLSEFNEFDRKNQNYYTLADYKIDRLNPRSTLVCETNKYHCFNKHIYKIPKIVLKSDVILSIPKFKTHRMAGITLNLKNMIGICEKIFLPHYRQGSPPLGDAVPKIPPYKDIFKRKLKNKFDILTRDIIDDIKRLPIIKHLIRPFYELFLKKTTIIEDWWGAWYGNDTLWRTILDLNKILLYSDTKGNIQNTIQRKYFSIIDGIIGQEGEGPMTGEPRGSGIIIGSFDPVASDTFAAYIMGYDINKLKVISKNKYIKNYKLGNSDLSKVKILSNKSNIKNLNLNFELPKGYKAISRKKRSFEKTCSK